MADIFISYGKADKAPVSVLAEALERYGWSVWWDRRIPAGKTFDEVIEEALDAARCILVVWTKTSVTSRWVKIEAGEGFNRNILIPVLFGEAHEVKIPLAFRSIQYADLSAWDETVTHPEFVQLINDLTKILGPPPFQPSKAAPSEEADSYEKINQLLADDQVEEAASHLVEECKMKGTGEQYVEALLLFGEAKDLVEKEKASLGPLTDVHNRVQRNKLRHDLKSLNEHLRRVL